MKGKLQSITVEHLENIKSLMDKGFRIYQTAKIIGLTTTCVGTYYHILPAIHSGQPIPESVKRYSHKAVNDYCRKHDLTLYRPIAVIQPSADNYEQLSMLRENADEIANIYEALAKIDEDLLPIFTSIADLCTQQFLLQTKRTDLQRQLVAILRGEQHHDKKAADG